MIVIAICLLLLFAYVFDLTASKTKIPSVILMLVLGLSVQQVVSFFKLNMVDLSPVLPYLGTIGLILIVLEGSLELEINQSKFSLIKRSLVVAFFPMIVAGLLMAAIVHYGFQIPFKPALASVIPLCVISSAIAIPSVKYLSNANREFVTYESSLSDILGVIFFNFIAQNEVIELASVTSLLTQIAIILVISVLSIFILSFLIKKIDHHIKFTPVIITIILIYFVVKEFHLPALIFIVLFGLFLSNFDEIKKLSWMQKFSASTLQEETQRFHEIVKEAAFLVRSVFFLLFGYLINTADLLNSESLIWALVFVSIIFLTRFLQLKISKMPVNPLVFFAPRGLITILLFMSLSESNKNSIITNALIIQVILITALIMMVGLLFNKIEITTET